MSGNSMILIVSLYYAIPTKASSRLLTVSFPNYVKVCFLVLRLLLFDFASLLFRGGLRLTSSGKICVLAGKSKF